jgi:hypothetical protein
METKQTKIEEFVKKVNELKAEMLGEENGFVLLTYEEIDGNSQQNSFAVGGKLNRIAECFVSFMKSEPMMANVVMAASSAIAQTRLMEAQMLAEAKGETKKKSKKAN